MRNVRICYVLVIRHRHNQSCIRRNRIITRSKHIVILHKDRHRLTRVIICICQCVLQGRIRRRIDTADADIRCLCRCLIAYKELISLAILYASPITPNLLIKGCSRSRAVGLEIACLECYRAGNQISRIRKLTVIYRKRTAIAMERFGATSNNSQLFDSCSTTGSLYTIGRTTDSTTLNLGGSARNGNRLTAVVGKSTSVERQRATGCQLTSNRAIGSRQRTGIRYISGNRSTILLQCSTFAYIDITSNRTTCEYQFTTCYTYITADSAAERAVCNCYISAANGQVIIQSKTV